MSLDRDLNLAIDFSDNWPNLISFSISTNSGTVVSARIHIKGRERALVLLSEDFGEIEGMLDSFVPAVRLKSKFHGISPFVDRW
jgi:hypothetical protein